MLWLLHEVFAIRAVREGRSMEPAAVQSAGREVKREPPALDDAASLPEQLLDVNSAELATLKQECSDAEADGLDGTYDSDCSGEYLKDEPVSTETCNKLLLMFMLRPCTVRLERTVVDKGSINTPDVTSGHKSHLLQKHIHAQKSNCDNEIGNKKAKVDTKSKIFSCDTCNAQFTIKRKLINHLRICSREIRQRSKAPTQKPFSCNHCTKQFLTKARLTIHARVHTGEKLNRCETCTEQLSQHSQSSQHKLIQIPCTEKKTRYCATCGKKYTEKYYFATNMQFPAEQEPQKCDIRTKQFTQDCNLIIHKKTHMPNTTKSIYCCETCNKKFTTKNILVIHMRTHTGEKPYCCDVCQKQFTQLGSLTVHKRIHTGEKPYSCDLCPKQFKQLCGLTSHKRIHTGEKPYNCDVCSKQFAQSSHLTSHKRVHMGEKPFSCDVCPKQFTHFSNLTVHKRIHTGEKPYCCDVCQKRFTQLCSLTVHKRNHTGEKLYCCDVCQKQFAQLCHLIRHKRIHTGEKPYACDVCPKQFARSSHLTSHKRVHMGGETFLL